MLTLLQVVLGSLLLVGVFALTVMGLGLPEVVPHVRLFPVRLFVVAIVLFGLAMIEFLLAYGSWNGVSWAWVVSLIFGVLGIVFLVFSLFLRPGIGEIVSLIVNLLVVYYLMHPRVQAYFGRGTESP